MDGRHSPPPLRVGTWCRRLLVLLVPPAIVFGTGAYLLLYRYHWFPDRLNTILAAELSARLGREVTVGRVYGTFLTQAVVEDVKVAEKQRVADGTVFSAKKLVLRYRLLDVLKGRSLPARSVDQVDAYGVVATVERDAKGVLNWEKIYKPAPPRPGDRFRAVVNLHDALVYYRDASVRTLDGAPTKAALRRVSATADFGGEDFVRGHLTAREASGRIGGWLRAAVVVDKTHHVFALRAGADAIQARAVLDYLRLPEDLALRGGRADVVANVASGPGEPGEEASLAYSVRLDADDVQLSWAKWPHPIRVWGPAFIGPDLASTEGLMATSGTASVRVAGQVADFKQPVLNLHADATGLDLDLVRHLAPDVRELGWVSSPELCAARAEVTGRADKPLISAEVAVPQVQVGLPEGPTFGASDIRVSASALNTDGAWVVGGSGRMNDLLGERIPGLAEYLGATMPPSLRSVGHASVRGGYEDGKLRLSGDFDLPEARVGTQTASVQGRFAADGDKVLVEGLEVGVAGGRVSGRAGGIREGGQWRLFAQGQAEGLMISQLRRWAPQKFALYPVFGRVTSDFAFAGKGSKRFALARGRVDDLTLSSYPSLKRVRLVAKYSGEGVQLPLVAVEDPRVQVTAAGSVASAKNADLKLSLRKIDASALARLFGYEGHVRGEVAASATVKGDLNRPTADATITAFNAEAEGIRADTIAANVHLDGDAGVLEVREVLGKMRPPWATGSEAAQLPFTLRLEGKVESIFKPRETRLDIAVEARSQDLRNVVAGTQLAGLASGVARFEGRVGGALKDPSLTGVVWVPRGTLAGETSAGPGARVRVTKTELVVSDVSVSTPEATLAGSLRVADLLSKRSLDGSLTVYRARLPDFLRDRGLPWEEAKGQGEAKIYLAGTLADPQVTAEVAVRGLSDGALDFGQTCKATVGYASGLLWAEGIEARGESGRLTGYATLARREDWLAGRLNGRDLELAHLTRSQLVRKLLGASAGAWLSPVSRAAPKGRASLAVELAGHMHNDRSEWVWPSGEATLTSPALALGKGAPADTTVELKFTPNRLDLRNLTTKGGPQYLTASGYLRRTGQATFTLVGRRVNIAPLGAAAGVGQKLAGAATMRLALSGNVRKSGVQGPSVAGELSIEDLALEGVRLGSLKVKELRLGADRLEAQGVTLTERPVAATAAPDRVLEIEQCSLPFSFRPLGFVPGGEMLVAVRLSKWRLRSLSPLVPLAAAGGTSGAGKGALRAVRDALANAVGEINVYGAAGEGGTPGPLRVEGSLSQPGINGQVEVAAGSIPIPGLKQSVNDLRLVLAFDKPPGKALTQVRVQEGRAELRRTAPSPGYAGAIHLEGQADLASAYVKDWRENRYQVTLRAEALDPRPLLERVAATGFWTDAVAGDFELMLRTSGRGPLRHEVVVKRLRLTGQEGGKLWLEGSSAEQPARIVLGADQAEPIQARLRADNMLVRYAPYFRGRVDGTLQMSATSPKQVFPVRVEGALEADRCSLTLAVPERGAEVAIPPIFNWVTIDRAAPVTVRVGARSRLLLSIPRMDAPVTGSVMVWVDALRNLRASGELDGQRGGVITIIRDRWRVVQMKAELHDLTVGFPPTPESVSYDASLDAQAEMRKRYLGQEYDVTMTLRGPLRSGRITALRLGGEAAPGGGAVENLQLALRSTPMLPESQLQAMVGYTAEMQRLIASGSLGALGGQVFGLAKEQAREELLGLVERGLSTGLGLGEVAITYEPAYGQQPLISVGQEIFNVFWRYTALVNDPQRRFTLEGKYTVLNRFTLDIWTNEQKELRGGVQVERHF